ncbi:MAG TPA: FkbM family methyltransferase [Opitutaceae bacterium]|nr:FkbM family methyltransferase [Opitutaceae bacterium]
MTIRKWFKRWLYGSCPGLAGAFPYFGTRVYFPKGSLAFQLAVEQGIFERENVELLRKLCRPRSCYFDVGANLGLTSLPMLQSLPDCRVLSFEPSPNSLPWLERTIAESPYARRWTLVPKAVGAAPSIAEFSLSPPAFALYDGLKGTQRAASVRRVQVEVTTLDVEWERIGRPDVSAIKVDVEGGELDVLRGGFACIKACRPHILLEWNAANLAAYGRRVESILPVASDLGCCLFSVPKLQSATNAAELRLQMMETESFLLAPL